MDSIEVLRHRTQTMLDEWRRDPGPNPLRALGEADCMVELKIIREMEENIMEEEKATQLDCWAIVELFGHQRIAGRVKSENFGSACLIRVDVPEVEKKGKTVFDYDKNEYIKSSPFRVASFTKFIGVASIYALSPVTEELARSAASEIASEPVSVFGLESVRKLANKALPQPEELSDQDDDEEDDRERSEAENPLLGRR